MPRTFVLTTLLLLIAAPLFAQTLVVGHKDEDTVGFIDLEKGEMVAKRPTGHHPHEVSISPDGKTAAVVAYGWGEQPDNRISIFDVASASERKVIELGEHTRPHGILWLSDGRRLVATAEGSGHLLVVDVEAGKVAAAIPTTQEGSHMVALAPAGHRAYVANIGSDSFSVLDIEEKKHVRNVPSGKESEGIAVTPDGGEVWVANRGEDTLKVFDARTFRQKAEIETGRMPIRVAISPDGNLAVTSNARESSLTIVDVASKQVIETIDLLLGGVPITAIFHPDGEKLYVSLTYSGEVIVLSRDDWSYDGSVIGHPPGVKAIAAGQGADGLGYTPVRLNVTD